MIICRSLLEESHHLYSWTGDSGSLIFAFSFHWSRLHICNYSCSTVAFWSSDTMMKLSSISILERLKPFTNPKCNACPHREGEGPLMSKLNRELEQSRVCAYAPYVSLNYPWHSALILIAIKIPIRKHIQMCRAGRGFSKYWPATLSTLATIMIIRGVKYCQQPTATWCWNIKHSMHMQEPLSGPCWINKATLISQMN